MLKTIKFHDKKQNNIMLKKINNIFFIVLKYGWDRFRFSIEYNKFKNFFSYTYVYYFLRIMWRGKAYRVRFFKKSQKFTLNFGHSHWCKITYDLKTSYFFKRKRQSYVFFFYNRLDIKESINFFNNIRNLNKYTKRGLKIKQSPYIRRFGKISQVNSSLHSFN